MGFETHKPHTECIGQAVLQSQIEQARGADYPGYIEVPEGASGASQVLVQAYVDPDQLADAGLTFDDIAGKPLVTINESESDRENASYNSTSNVLSINSVPVGGYTTPGQKLLNWGNYLIETPKNIGNAMIIPFNRDINVYIALTYFK